MKVLVLENKKRGGGSNSSYGVHFCKVCHNLSFQSKDISILQLLDSSMFYLIIIMIYNFLPHISSIITSGFGIRSMGEKKINEPRIISFIVKKYPREGVPVEIPWGSESRGLACRGFGMHASFVQQNTLGKGVWGLATGREILEGVLFVCQYKLRCHHVL